MLLPVPVQLVPERATLITGPDTHIFNVLLWGRWHSKSLASYRKARNSVSDIVDAAHLQWHWHDCSLQGGTRLHDIQDASKSHKYVINIHVRNQTLTTSQIKVLSLAQWCRKNGFPC